MWHMTNVRTRAKNAGSEFGRKERSDLAYVLRDDDGEEEETGRGGGSSGRRQLKGGE